MLGLSSNFKCGVSIYSKNQANADIDIVLYHLIWFKI